MSWGLKKIEGGVFLPGRVSRVRFVFFLEEFDMRHAQDLAHDAHRERQRGNLANGKRISGSWKRAPE